MEQDVKDIGARIGGSWLLRGAVFALLGLATWALCHVTPPPISLAEPGVVLDLPESVAGLRGKAEPPRPEEKFGLPADTQFAKRVYSGSAAETLTAQIVLSGADRRSIHRPEACLRGQGWTIQNGGLVPIRLSDGKQMDVMKLIIDRPIESPDGGKRILRSLYLYWFVSKTLTTPLHRERLARTYLDLLLHNRSHRWAYIIVSAPVLRGFVTGGKDEAETLDLLKRFIAEAAPQFQRVESPAADTQKVAL
ncbi:MAG: exosortase-associated EpsI family protein [Terrimicrobiaceae bacterium]|nr:exosortase-associated EpsI family protein [Terrimicrobiaceae bacterium]